MDGADRGAARARLGQQHLHIAELPLFESSFAIAQVKLPHAHEAFRIAQCADVRLSRQEPFTPKFERSCVVRADILHMEQLEVRGSRQGVHQDLHGRDEAAGENESLDEVELAAWTFVMSLLLNLDETITKG